MVHSQISYSSVNLECVINSFHLCINSAVMKEPDARLNCGRIWICII